MGKITIYRFCLYDIRSDELVLSKRWGTAEAIAKIGGQVMETSAFETDDVSVLSDIAGLTAVGFTPPTASIIQLEVEDVVGAESIAS